MRHSIDDPALLKPHERLRELAAILARGIQRCRTGIPATPETAAGGPKSLKNQQKSSPNGLEFLSTSRRREPVPVYNVDWKGVAAGAGVVASQRSKGANKTSQPAALGSTAVRRLNEVVEDDKRA